MAAISQAQVKLVHQAFARQCALEGIHHAGYAKADLDSSITALDSYFDTNDTAMNATLTQPFKGAASLREKAILTTCLINERYKGP